ncbi:hypothetical protein [Variovorax boronicumulans]|uniref:hypothetical protein n=1 Tax=Variovorax boronicumulans TaxID=436515 RepID=UPI001112E354|nr:hypothetical protein [Variovorax boronicumulans]
MFDPSFIDVATVDHWYDFGHEQSQNVLQRFDDEQWTALRAGWCLQAVEWQDRLAYILGANGAPREYSLLMELYRLGPQEVRLTAAETLRSLALNLVVGALPSDEMACMKSELGQQLDINAVLRWATEHAQRGSITLGQANN